MNNFEQRLQRLEQALVQSEQQRQELEKQVQQLREELGQITREKQPVTAEPNIANDAHIEEVVNKVIEGKQIESVPDWVKNTKISGDFRYRYEYTDDHAASDDRHRNRIRARLGLTTKINDEVLLGFRIASGNTESPTSTNQDLDNAFSSKNIWLDLAYFDYRPMKFPNLEILGGKIKNPYFFPGNSDLIFDTDVNPEGAAVHFKADIAEDFTSHLTGGGYSVEERVSGADTSLWGVQEKLVWDISKENNLSAIAAVSYFDFGNIEGQQALGSDAAQFFGNSSSGGRYINDYDLMEVSGEITWGETLPFSVFADYVKNVSASTSEDTGYLVGAAFGDLTKVGGWEFAYNYRELQADAVIAIFADATIGGGGTSLKGHKFTFGYHIAKNVWTALGLYLAEKSLDDPDDHNVVTADMIFKF